MRLLDWVKREKLNITELSDMLGYSAAHVYGVMAKTRRPGLGFIVAVKKVTNDEVDFIDMLEFLDDC